LLVDVGLRRSWDDIMPVQVIFADRVADPSGSQCLVL
jgi:hypothetical protein